MAVTPHIKGKTGIEFRGLRELMGKLGPNGEVNRRVVAAGTRGMIEVTEHLLREAQKIVPHDEGELQGSGSATIYVDGKRVSGQAVESDESGPGLKRAGSADVIEGHVTFNKPYALVQHEREDYVHPKGRKAKYLEGPMKENADRYADLLGDKIQEELHR